MSTLRIYAPASMKLTMFAREIPVRIVNIATMYARTNKYRGTPRLFVFPMNFGNQPSLVASMMGYL